MVNILTPTNTKDNIILGIVFSVLFVLNSFIFWFSLTLFLLFNRTDNREKLFTFWCYVSIIFISLYNSTKIPENDLEWYVDYYLMANQYSFNDYLSQLNGGKEQIYQALVWIIHLLGGNNYHIYSFTISLLSYLFTLKGLFILFKSLNNTFYEKIAVIAILLFFPYLFANSLHIVRQFLATSIIFYVTTVKAAYNKNLWWFALIDIFIHTSVAFFIPFLFVSRFRQPIGKNNIYLYILILSGIISISIIANFILSATDGLPIEYLLNKAANGTTFETTLALPKLLFSVIITIIPIICTYLVNKKMKKVPVVNYYISISFFLLFFILANPNQSELQLRYNFFFWQLLPYLAGICLKGIKIYPKYLLLFMGLLFLFWNIYNLNMSEWTYTCKYLYVFYSAFHYFI